MSATQKLELQVTADIREIRDAIDEMNSRFKNFSGESQANVAKIGKKINGLGGTMAKFGLYVDGVTKLMRGLGRVFGRPIELAGDMAESISKFNVVFGDNAAAVQGWAHDFGRSVGRSRLELVQMLSTLQDTFVPLGYSRDQAADMSKTMTQLAVDVASFNNASDTEVLQAFQSAIVGNHETVRRYGIVITEETLKEEALRSGIVKTRRELTAQEKVQARLNMIIAGSADAIGDAERTKRSYANTIKRLKAFFDDLSVTVANKVLPAITDMLNKVLEAGRYIEHNFSVILFNAGQVALVAARWVMALATAVGTYLLWTQRTVIWQKIQVTWTRLQALWNSRATLAQKGLNMAMKMNPIGLLISVLTMAVAMFASTGEGITALKDIFMAFWATVKDVFSNFWALLKTYLYGITIPLRFAINAVKNFAKGFSDLFADIGKVLKGFWKILTGDFSAGWDMIKAGVTGIGENIKKTLIQSAKETADPVMDALGELDFSRSKAAWVKAGESTGKAFKAAFTVGLKEGETPTELEAPGSTLPSSPAGGSADQGGATGVEDLRASLDYMVYIQKMSLDKAREARMAFLREQIAAIQGATDEEIRQKIRLMQELERLENEQGSKRVGLVERIEQTLTGIQEKNAALREGFNIKERLSAAKDIVLKGIQAAVSGVKSAAAMPFPANVVAVPAVLAVIFAALKQAKNMGAGILKMAEGGIVNRPQLALIGEAVERTGPELVMPQRTFIRYMDKEVLPGILAKVGTGLTMTGVEGRLDRVEQAVKALRFPNEDGIARSVSRNLRGRF